MAERVTASYTNSNTHFTVSTAFTQRKTVCIIEPQEGEKFTRKLFCLTKNNLT